MHDLSHRTSSPLTMFVYDTYKRVRYAETDKMGYLYYGHYASYYEIGRVESIRSLGVSYGSMEDDMGIMLPVLALECKFIKPAYYDQKLTIRTMIREMPTKMITFHHEILNPEEEVINRGVVKLFFVDKNLDKRVSVPDIIAERLLPYFKNKA